MTNQTENKTSTGQNVTAPETWKISELKIFLKARDVSTANLIEKSDYVRRVNELLARGAVPVSTGGGGRKRTAAGLVAANQPAKSTSYPHFQPSAGYVTDKFRLAYIEQRMKEGLLPAQAVRMAHIASLTAPNDPSHPIYFWQLFSVLGEKRIEDIVRVFYTAVFDEQADWFTGTFRRLAPVNQHIWAQKMFWVDVMGGGRAYHGGEGRLNFHHSRATQILTRKGAEKWLGLMMNTLAKADISSDPRVRPAIGEFLRFFIDKYARDFRFDATGLDCGETLTNTHKKGLSLLELSEDEIRGLSVKQLRLALGSAGVSWEDCVEKEDLIRKATSLG